MNICNGRSCANCLNAYNGVDDNGVPAPLCINKEWEAQFRSVNTRIKANESCSTWQQRKTSQPKIDFHPVLQLSLF